jgi:two-component system cell cycle sensor histidine kinase/response regulator CckA
MVGKQESQHVDSTAAAPLNVESVLEEKGTILVMDDEDIVRTVAGKMLEFLGYRVTLVKNGEDALRMYQAYRDNGRRFDAVILDLVVPGGMDGAQTLSELLRVDPEVKAIISSGYGDSAPGPALKGHAGIIAKPYELKTLGTMMEKVIGAGGAGRKAQSSELRD